MKILFYSSLGYEADIKRAMSAGAQGYRVKPNGLGDLGEAIIGLINLETTIAVASAAKAMSHAAK